ncbi:30S ribosomal protein S1 [Rhynchospora pubera]|uniref:30S ribosomal protein S1 n=1 Tax=Rhynchospora pubera TaxID=906938 RepID=A0AAV8C3K2_9POAL|nr:30S ribosomal protein S1 [Rhynchospora pubera]
MRLHCHFPSSLFANNSSIKRRFIVLADSSSSSKSHLPPLRNPKPLPPPPPPPPPPPKPSPLLQLIHKPSPLQLSPLPTDTSPPFVNLFTSLTQSSSIQQRDVGERKESDKVTVDYYDPKRGDFVVGVVLSGNENKLDVSIGSDMLGSMVAKESLPFCNEEANPLVCDLNEEREKGLFEKGKVGIVRDDEGFREKGEEGRRAVEAGTVVFAEVLGRSLSGRPLLSCRRLFRQLAWHRVRQIMQLKEPFQVTISEWNTGGLLTRIEGIRAFHPKTELLSRVTNFTELKSHVGRRLHVSISRIDEATNVLIISEREAWDMKNLRPGTLLRGTVSKIFPYGAQVRIGDSSRCGLLHVSNISRARVTSVNDVLKVEEEMKVLVINSMFSDKIYLSTADLESEPGLFLSDKEKVYAEAEQMAKQYKKRLLDLSPVPDTTSDVVPSKTLSFDDEASLYANWKWFKFEHHDEIAGHTMLS